MGIEAQVRRAQSARPDQQNALSVRAGAAGRLLRRRLGSSRRAGRRPRPRDDRDRRRRRGPASAAAAIGDDRMQRMQTGRVAPDRFTHGSSEQRVDLVPPRTGVRRSQRLQYVQHGYCSCRAGSCQLPARSPSAAHPTRRRLRTARAGHGLCYHRRAWQFRSSGGPFRAVKDAPRSPARRATSTTSRCRGCCTARRCAAASRAAASAASTSSPRFPGTSSPSSPRRTSRRRTASRSSSTISPTSRTASSTTPKSRSCCSRIRDKLLVEEARRHVTIESSRCRPCSRSTTRSHARTVIWGADNIFKSLSRSRAATWTRRLRTPRIVVEGEYETGAQEQLYIEPNGMIAVGEPGRRRHGLGLDAVPVLRPQGARRRCSACRPTRCASSRWRPAAASAARKSIRR